MKASYDYMQFWKSRYIDRLAHPDPVRKLFLNVRDPKLIYELTFHSSFAKKIWDLMQREGSDVPGFPRMQQSFMEAVQRVRSMIETAGNQGFVQAPRYTELTQNGMQNMMSLIGDLAIVKQWQIDQGDKDVDEPNFSTSTSSKKKKA